MTAEHWNRAHLSRDPGDGRAFTLLELLLTLTIIAILTAAAAGVYGWARTRAAIKVSSDNLHQLVIANLGYAADHSGYFCPAQEPRNLKRWHGGRDTTDAPFEPDKGFLTPYLGNDKRLETCPLLLKTLSGGKSFEDGAGGYGYNAAYIGGSPADVYVSIAALDVEAPARTIMFATTALSKGDGIQEYPFVEPPFAPAADGSKMWDLQPSLHFRANGKAIIAWCDGHITLEAPSAFKTTNYYGGNNERDRIGWFGPEEENGYWNPHSAAVLDGSPAPAEADSKSKTSGGAQDQKSPAEIE